jgi:antitoxin CptB
MREQLIAKIKWRSRRGMLELDLLLNQFISTKLESLTDNEMDEVLLLLEEQDPDLYAWLMDYEHPNTKELAYRVSLVKSSR